MDVSAGIGWWSEVVQLSTGKEDAVDHEVTTPSARKLPIAHAMPGPECNEQQFDALVRANSRKHNENSIGKRALIFIILNSLFCLVVVIHICILLRVTCPLSFFSIEIFCFLFSTFAKR
jgi:hypothetical protein